MLVSRCLVWISIFAYLSLSVWSHEEKCTSESGICRKDSAQDDTPVEEKETVTVTKTKDKPAETTTVTTTEKTEHFACGMYMAESSIPNSGWGMYTAISRQKGDAIYPLDLVIQVPDIKRFMKLRRQYEPSLPTWLLAEYFWNPETTGAYYDATRVASIVPGLGMLANSHTGLVNSKERGPQYRMEIGREQVEAGAFSEYKDQTFVASQDIPAGMELMVEYGDEWFEGRDYAFGDAIPLSADFVKADNILSNVSEFCNHTFSTEFCLDFWQLIRHDLSNATSPRLLSALPNTLEEVQNALESGCALHSTPNVIRSMEWLQENGMCIDHLEPKESTIPHAGSGAFATRSLPKGTVVAPAPIVHMHRGHMDVMIVDEYDTEQIHWRGHQLLFNYLYGHASTSLVFFPYSPVVNFINHSPEPNVELQWSSRMARPEWMNYTTDQVVAENAHTGLMMEIVALRSIEEGEEIVLDYGRDWEAAWDKHVLTWQKPLNSDTHRPVEAIRKQELLPTQDEDDDMEPLPSNAMTVCWVDWDHVEEDEDTGEYIWQSSTPTNRIDETYPCTLVSRKTTDNEKIRYSASVEMYESVYRIENIPRRGIAIVDKMYTTNQMLRQSFRHEIHLPDHMIPESWKDREAVVESETCQLYMAESSIPNAGLGMFTGKIIKDLRDISFPEIAIQALDIDENHKLRRRSVGTQNELNTEPDCLINHYYWNPNFAAAGNEANDVSSIVPGVGMLANSHTGHVNALSRPPYRDNAGLRPQRDPGAGASTTYHGMRFVASKGDIPIGSEIFVEYGDTWFADSEERLGLIPLSGDYRQANTLLKQFWNVVEGDFDTDMSKDLWDLFLQASCLSNTSRVCLALPRDLEDVEDILDTGTGAYSVRDSIRSTEWLEKNGRCLDNIKPAMSSIPQAGRGAFATRHIGNGNVVATAPLVQLNQHQMEMFVLSDPENPDSEILPTGTQLLRNYCFGHKNSSILLYPYSPVVNYINHDHENFNAELQWSTLSHHRSDWLNRSVDELMRMPHAGLIMEFVATRDILPGEEILVDYGDRWEQAWKTHVNSWKPDPSHQGYSPAWELNDYTVPVRTQNEQISDPYPDHVSVGCYVGSLDQDQSGTRADGELEYMWSFAEDLYRTTLSVFPCEILERIGEYIDTADSIYPVGERYKARIWKNQQVPWIVTDIPRRAIEFFDDEYTSDLHLRNAFRHEMDLPDPMLPPAWNDIS